MTNEIQISVLVATRNRAGSLARLLDGLANQRGAPPFEVIVGDNGSSDNTEVVAQRAQSRLNIKYIYDDRPGKSRALNTALKQSQGDLIVFTDDDIQPDPNWLACLHDASIAYPDCNIFGGKILTDLNKVPKWISRSYNLTVLLTCKHDIGNTDIRYGFHEYPFGPNMAVRKRCLSALNNPYPEYLGPGNNYPVGDEAAFFLLFSPPDAKDRMFVASACVVHEIEDENILFISAAKRCYLAGRTSGMLGFPIVSSHESKQTSTLSLILARLKTCRSFRELFCTSLRYLGYLQGRREC